jgi:quercetin dioxygenase-like cupin family protein
MNGLLVAFLSFPEHLLRACLPGYLPKQVPYFCCMTPSMLDPEVPHPDGSARRSFLKHASGLLGVALLPPLASSAARLPQFSPVPSALMSTTPKVVRAAGGHLLPHMLGNQMYLKLTGEDTHNLITVTESVYAPGFNIPLHVHTREDEMFMVVEGKFEFTIGSEHFTLEAGDMAFGPRNIPHGFRLVSDKPSRMIVQFTPSGLEAMFRELNELPVGPPDRAKMAAICSRHGVTFV